MVCQTACRVWMLAAVPVFAAYDESDAVKYAYLSTAAMCAYGGKLDNDNALEAWQCGPPCDAVPGMTQVRAIHPDRKNDAFAFIGKLGSRCLAVFRGTSNVPGWIQDAKSIFLVKKDGCSFSGHDCKVGNGFLENYNSIDDYLKGNLSDIGCGKDSELSITGHSLGGAEAALAAFDFKRDGYNIVDVYTFGQPRVGNEAWANAFIAEGIVHWRVTHANDPVPHLPNSPLGFRHITTEIYYSSRVADGYKICNGDASGEDRTCSHRHSAEVIPVGAACGLHPSTCPHLTYMRDTKTISMDGGSCTGEHAESLLV